MRNEDMENKLRLAVEHATPDVLDKILTRLESERPAVIPMPAKPGRKNNWMARITAAAAMAVVLVGISFGAYRFGVSHRVDSVIELDVNPSIELQVNSKERVLDVRALNADAEGIIGGMDLKNTNLDVAINALVGSMLTNGYINDLANSILVSVENSDAARGAELQQRLSADIGALLSASAIDGAILSQTMQASDPEVSRMVEAYGISQGKAALIIQILAQNPLLKEGDLAGLTINELNLLASSRDTQLPSVQSTGTASDKAYIGADAAAQAAMQAAGVTEVQQIKTELDAEDGRMVYEVEFIAGDSEYEYDIDAATGEVVKAERERYDGYVPNPQATNPPPPTTNPGQPATNPGQDAPAANAASYIGETAAEDIALAHAGVARADAGYIKTKLDIDDDGDDPDKYEVEFYAGRTEYEYEIDAASGTILDADWDIDD